MSLRDGPARRKASGDEAGQIDLTPMLDVVFIMLIFFIVTSSFVKEPGVELFKPQASTTESCDRGTIIFAVDDRGDIYYDKKKVPLEQASRLVEIAKKEAPQANMVIQVDQDTPAYVVEDLYDAVRDQLTSPPCVSTDDEA
jgi:biopolymer transport protein ExbD